MSRLQESADTFDRRFSRLSTSAQVEHEAWIPDCIAPEAGWCDLAPIQELLDFTK